MIIARGADVWATGLAQIGLNRHQM